jgi:hypothetical protein
MVAGEAREMEAGLGVFPGIWTYSSQLLLLRTIEPSNRSYTVTVSDPRSVCTISRRVNRRAGRRGLRSQVSTAWRANRLTLNGASLRKGRGRSSTPQNHLSYSSKKLTTGHLWALGTAPTRLLERSGARQLNDGKKR